SRRCTSRIPCDGCKDLHREQRRDCLPERSGARLPQYREVNGAVQPRQDLAADERRVAGERRVQVAAELQPSFGSDRLDRCAKLHRGSQRLSRKATERFSTCRVESGIWKEVL